MANKPAGKKSAKRRPAGEEPGRAEKALKPAKSNAARDSRSESPATRQFEPSDSSSGRPPIPVVGIGASAGGLDALNRFFSRLPKQTGLAFVLVPHLDPTHKSMMVELLSKQTELPVGQAEEGMPVEADHVYIIPPNRYLSLSGGRFSLSVPEEGRAMAIAIDGFFRSLAADQGERAIGIALSGTGNHGVAGLREIKLAGGMVMAQQPDTADFDQMPRSAIAAGLVDAVLPPEEMPRAIVEFIKRFYEQPRSGAADAPALDREIEPQVDAILELVHAHTKSNFQLYRKKMLSRRILRRMGLRQIDRLGEYLELLRANPSELAALYKDLLIGVTSFFREPEAFEVLEQRVIPGLVQRSDGRTVRVWVPGCSTGEEAYSIGMLLIEGFVAAKRAPAIQIFATDIDDDSLKVARHGRYPESIVADVSAQRLGRYFVKTGEHHFQVTKQLRDTVLFAPQNLISDAPYSQLDLLSCRNLLIYLEPEMQQKVISLFHFVLKSGATLILGQSESVGRQIDLFEPISRKWRVFRRIGSARHNRVDIPIIPDFRQKSRGNRAEAAPRSAAGISHVMQKALIEAFAPASALINRQFQILCQHGPLNSYLEFHSGEPTRNLLSLVRQGMRVKLRAAAQRAMRDGITAVDASVRVKHGDGYVSCTITVKPIPDMHDEGMLLVSFLDRTEPVVESAAGLEGSGAESNSALVRQLEEELKSTRDELQSSIEELEGSHAELKVSHEEVMSINEELQSANEELETSKEELQSLNEELTTVNNQLQSKVEELERANNDISNLLVSTDFSLVFLDTTLRIVRFTPPAAKLLSLLPSDRGRPYRDLSPKFDDQTLLEECQRVLQDQKPAKKEVWSEGSNGAADCATGGETTSPRCYLRHILPYYTADRRIEGVVITLADITDRISAEAKIRRLAAVLRDSNDAVILYDLEGNITTWNRGAAEMYGYAEPEAVNMNLRDLLPKGSQAAALAHLRSLTRTQKAASLEAQRRTKDGRIIDVWLNATFLPDEAGERIAIATTERDITDRKKYVTDLERLKKELQRNENRLRAIVDSAADAIITIGENGQIDTFNRAAESMFGYSVREMIGENFKRLMASPYREGQDGELAAYLQTEQNKIRGTIREVVGQRKDGTIFAVELAVSQLSDGVEPMTTVLLRDMSLRNELQREVLEVAEQEQRRIGQDLHDSTQQELSGLGMIAHNLYEALQTEGASQAKIAGRISAGIGRALENVRRISRGMVPAEVEAHGLRVALSELAKQTSESGKVNCQFECDDKIDIRDQFVGTHLYRIAQEAITNVLKHAKAEHIWLSLETEKNFISLRVTDDGKGMSDPSETGKGIGLKVMFYRAGMIGGSLRIESLEGGGAQVSCTVPVD